LGYRKGFEFKRGICDRIRRSRSLCTHCIRNSCWYIDISRRKKKLAKKIYIYQRFATIKLSNAREKKLKKE